MVLMAIVERPPGGLVRAPMPSGPEEEPDVAVFDLRLPWPLGPTFLVVGVLFALVFGLATAALGRPIYHGDMQLLVVRLDSSGAGGVTYVDRRVTAIAAIGRSDPFLIELQRESGVDLTIKQLETMVTATRPHLGVVVSVTVDGHDQAQVEALTEHLPTAMAATIDAYRTGLVPLMNDTERAISPELAGPDNGPMYLQLFDQPSIPGPQVSETSPRVLVMALLGFGFGEIVAFIVAAMAHSRFRLTSREDLEELLDADQLGAIPRPRRRGGRRAGRMMLGFANQVAGLAGADFFTVGVAGSGTERLVTRTTATLAAATAAVSGQPVVFVDLHDKRSRRRVRPGVLEVASEKVGLDQACRRLSRRSLPYWARRFGRGVPLRTIGLGRSGTVEVELAMARVVALLAPDNIVIVALPTMPGPTPIGSTLGAVDVGLLAVLDGWTPLDDARVVVDALDAGVRGTVRFVLIEN
jgi:capsular polysaccharide biosynthesis protein